MQRSSERILTTHVGSLVRTRAIIEGLKARELKQPYDQNEFAEAVRSGVAEVVARQVEVGIDIPNDGEFSRPGYTTYVNDRLGGLEPRGLEEGEVVFGHHPERQKFPEFFAQYDKHYRYLWMLPEVSLDDVPNLMGNHERFRVTGPITYTGQAAVQSDIDNLKAALTGKPVADAFVTAGTPVARHNDRDVLKFYPSLEAYLYAVADAIHAEYTAIVNAGFILQVDFGALNPRTQLLLLENRHPSDEDVRRAIELGIEVLNHALRDIPEDRDSLPPLLGQYGQSAHAGRTLARRGADAVENQGASVRHRGRQSTPRARVDDLARSQAAGWQNPGTGRHLAPDERGRAPGARCLADQ